MNDCVKRNFELRNYCLNSEVHKIRIKILKSFIKGDTKVVDVGCGAFMPFELNVSNACDIDSQTKNFLKKLGWKGEFKKASVIDLPYKDKEFSVAICSEVIEHLKTKEQVLQAFNELNRIAHKWIITTPSAYDKDPDHNFHFGYNDDNLFDFIPKDLDCIVVCKGYYYYISNDKNKLCKITGVKNG